MANTFMRELKVNKEGIIIGALTGFAATVWLKVQGASLTFALATPGPLDTTLSSVVGVANLATTKVGLTLIIVGALIGYFVDSKIAPNK